MKLKFKIYILSLLLGLMSFVYGQDDAIILMDGKISTTSGVKLSGVSVVVKSGGSTVASTTTASNGKYRDLRFPMGAKYTVTFSKSGYVSKTLSFDAETGFFLEDAPEVTPFDIPIELFEKKPDVDYSPITSKPIGHFKINPSVGNLAPDAGYNSTQRKKIDKFFKELDKKANEDVEKFDKLVKAGDDYVAKGDFQAAIDSYNQAVAIKEDASVTTKISGAEQKLEQKSKYDKAISEGDNLLASNNFDGAIAKYNSAKTLLPGDKLADEKIKEAQDKKAAAANAKLDEEYNAKLTEAKNALNDKDYGFAKQLYAEAGTIKPSESEPPAKIKEIDKIISDQLANEQKYAELVAAGDKAMLAEDFDTAISKFTEAINIKEEAHPKTELAKAKDLKAKKEQANKDAAANKKKFDDFISNGDKDQSAEKFDDAISKFEGALELDIDNELANTKIQGAKDAKKAAEDKAAEDAASAKQAEFDAFIASGIDKVKWEKYDDGIAEFEKALALGVDDAKANDEIAKARETKKRIEELKAKQDAEKAKEVEFAALIKTGDQLLTSEEFDSAISDYTKALALGIDDTQANERIADANSAKKALADKQNKDSFDKLVASGDQKFNDSDYENALKEFKEALDLNFDNKTANAKIQAVEYAMADAKKADEEAAVAKVNQEKFDAFITSGDGKLSSVEFDNAISEYQSALALGVDDATANEKIIAAQKAKTDAELAAKDAEAAAAAKAKQEQFDAFITSGDGKLSSAEFDNAISEYQSALALGVDDATANEKITAAQKAKTDAELAAKDAEAAAAAKAKQEQFDAFITSGDGKLSSVEFDNAISEYQSALALGVDDATANEKITAAQKAKSDAAQAANDADAAAAAKAKQEQFDAFITSGDGKLSSVEFDNAISEYQSALALGVDDATANEKITAAQKAKSDAAQAANDADAAAAAKAKQEQFDALITSGDGKLSSAEFDNAISEYQSALALGVDDATANEKITAAQKAKSDAAQAANDADAAAAAAAKAKQEQFDAFITSGDGKLSSAEFDNAISEYQSALALGVDDATANEKITAAQKAKSDAAQAANDADAAAAAKAKQEQFDAFITSGDGKLNSAEFDNAISEYQSALALGVDDATANEKITAAQKAKSDVAQAANDADAAAAAKAKQEQFDAFITSGDGKLSSAEFDKAISEYQSALALGVDDATANEKITAAQKAKSDAELASKDADAAAAAKAKQEQFDALIQSGDQSLTAEAFDEAISGYQEALALNVDNSTANERIADAKSAQKALADKLANDNAASALDKEFNDLINQGDVAKDAKGWAEAKQLYSQAASKKPESSIPQEKIDEVNRLMVAETKSTLDAEFDKVLAVVEKLKAKEEYEKAKGLLNKKKTLYPAKEGRIDAEVLKIDEIIAALKAKENEYKSLLAKADNSFEGSNWEAARGNYKKAIAVFDRAYPQEQLAKIDQAIADADNASNAEADKLAALKDKFDAFIKIGSDGMSSSDYKGALNSFESALALGVDDGLAKKKIKEAEDAIAKAELSDANSALNKAFNDLITKGDQARDAKEWSDAKGLYSKASEKKPDSSIPQEKIDEVNRLMKAETTDKLDAEFSKVIAVVEKLKGAKKYDKAIGLLNSKKPLYPNKKGRINDEIAKINKLIDALKNADKARNAYNDLITSGNSLFGEEEYRKSKGKFQGALDLKPDASYPQEKIDEINKILQDLADAKRKAAQEAEANIPPSEYPYGEPVANMSDASLQDVFKDQLSNDDDERAKKYADYKEEKLGELNGEKDFEVNRSDILNETYDEYEQNRSDGEAGLDLHRENVVPNIEDYKAEELNRVEDLSETQLGRSDLNNSNYETYNNDRYQSELNKDTRRKDILNDVEQYKSDQLDLGEELTKENRDVTYENKEEYKALISKYEEYAKDGDLTRAEKNVPSVNDYKYEKLEELSSLTQEGVDATESTYAAQTKVYEELSSMYEMNDNSRQDNVGDLEEYKESELNKTSNLTSEGVLATEATYEAQADVYEELASMYEENDLTRQGNIVDVEDYKEDELGRISDLGSEGVLATEATYAAQTDVYESLSSLYTDNDDSRKETVVDMVDYKESELDKLDDLKSVGVLTTESTYDAQTELNKNISNQFNENDKSRNENIDKYQNYTDNKYKADGSDYYDHQDGNVDKTNDYNSIKNQKSTMFSDGIVDPLAKEYPQGITEKTFQRTSSNGDVLEVTVLRIVVIGNKADEYRKVRNRWSTTFFKNGGITTQQVWDTETHK